MTRHEEAKAEYVTAALFGEWLPEARALAGGVGKSTGLQLALSN